MPTRRSNDDWDDDADDSWEDDGLDDEGDFDSLPEGAYLDDEIPTRPCPYCREDICEDAVRCPFCESYLSTEDAPADSKPWWIVLGAIVCLLVALMWVFR